MANDAQIARWDGPSGEHWAAEAERYDRMNGGFTDHIVSALAPRSGEHVVDVGCGNGALTMAIAPRVAPGRVTGLDISGPMLSTARRRVDAAGIDNVTFVTGDAQVHRVEGPVDAVVSRFGVMFFDDPVAAFRNLASSVRPGGRVAFTCWRELLANEWLMVPVAAALAHVPLPDLGPEGAPGPFSLADPDRVRAVLRDAGFVDVETTEVRVPMPQGSSIDDAVSFMRRTEMAEVLLADVDHDAAERVWDAVARALEPHQTGDGVVLNGTAWLVTAQTPDA